MTPVPKTSASSLRIRASNLTPEAFAPFGTVIQNPATHANQPSNILSQPANQGSATKWLDVTSMRDWYDLSASRKPARVVMNMFVCRPRRLRNDSISTATASTNGNEQSPQNQQKTKNQLFDVQILERHPFTPQTFIPLSLSSSKSSPSRYLVIVAPTLPLKRTRSPTNPSSSTTTTTTTAQPPYPTPPLRPRRRRSLRERLLGARPNPFTNDFASSTTPLLTSTSSSSNGEDGPSKPKGPGLPDLANLRAFVVRGDQAVTYGPGTWHAPMVVLGAEEVEFVVVQFANGVGVEDCQEIEIVAEEGQGGGVVVEIEDGDGDEEVGLWRGKAKL